MFYSLELVLGFYSGLVSQFFMCLGRVIIRDFVIVREFKKGQNFWFFDWQQVRSGVSLDRFWGVYFVIFQMGEGVGVLFRWFFEFVEGQERILGFLWFRRCFFFFVVLILWFGGSLFNFVGRRRQGWGRRRCEIILRFWKVNQNFKLFNFFESRSGVCWK